MAKIFIVDNNYTGQGKPLNIVVDTMYFIELIDTSSPHHTEAEVFFTESSNIGANLYMTAKTNEELMHRLQIFYTTDYAKQINLNPNQEMYKKGNPGFKKLQSHILSRDPNYFEVISYKREQMMKSYRTIADIIYPNDLETHINSIPILQKKLNGCVEVSDISTILTANEYGINTFATSDGGFNKIKGINIITPRKGIYTQKTSSTSFDDWIDITK